MGGDDGEVEDVRDHGARLWDALVTTRRHALGSDVAPDAHGARPRLAVTTSLEALRGRLGAAGVTDDGRASRLVTPAIWRALVCRDRHCAFPGCTRPPVMGHAHHLRHWADHGPTALTNLVLLCGHHHRTVHHTPWQVRLNPTDATPEFLPPPRPGTHHPPPAWIRHRPRRE